MNITKLFHEAESGDSGLASNVKSNLDTPVNVDGRTVYRNVYYLRFNFDEYANGIRINATDSHLNAKFESYFLHLTSGNDTFQTREWKTEENDKLVKVHLTHPWRLSKIKTYDARGIDVLRLDGDAISEEPTIKTNANTTISAEFIGQDFALRKMPVYAQSDISKAIESSKQASKKGKAQNSKAISSETENNVLINEMDDKVTVALGLKSVPAHGIQWIQLKSYPTGPRIQLGKVNTPFNEDTQLTSLWSEPGEHTDNSALVTQASKESIIQQVQVALDRFLAKAKADGLVITNLFIPVVIESDTPAHFMFTNLNVSYSLVKTQWDHWTEQHKQAGKETIHFSGDTLTKYDLQLAFPSSAQIEKAIIHLGNDISETSGFAVGDLAATLDHVKGVQLNQDHVVAKPIVMSQATQVNKAAIAVLPIDENVNLAVKLQAEQDGKPAGAVLAQSMVQLKKSKNRHWVIVQLDQSVLLDTGNYWLCVSSMEGVAIWLADHGTEKASIERQGTLNTVNNTQLLGKLGLSLPVNHKQQTINISLQIGPDLQAAVGTEIDISSSLNNTIPESIQLISGEAGAITLYSPEFEYSY